MIKEGNQKMKRARGLEVLENVSHKGLYSVLIFYKSPITNEIEERHMYADANAECIQIAEKWLAEYCNLDIPCIIYLNGGIYLMHKHDMIEFEE